MQSESTKQPTKAEVPLRHEGVVVPMITPVTHAGNLDESAVDRLVDTLLAGRVNGIFVLGTTGEGAMVSSAQRQRLVERVVARVQSRALVYAGIGGLDTDDALTGNKSLEAGADAVVARSPIAMPEAELQGWFGSLLDRLNGPTILYNIPILTKVSIPLDVVSKLLGHPRFIGIKDSENNLERLTTLLQRCGNRPGFSVFVGVGKLMEQGLRLGADGIVPSVGNLIPSACQQLWECARREDWPGAAQQAARMNSVAAVYQAGRSLGESLSALKGALSLRGVCDGAMLPPLSPLTNDALQALASELDRLKLLPENKTASPENTDVHPPLDRASQTL